MKNTLLSILFVPLALLACVYWTLAYIFGGREWREWLRDGDD